MHWTAKLKFASVAATQRKSVLLLIIIQHIDLIDLFFFLVVVNSPSLWEISNLYGTLSEKTLHRSRTVMLIAPDLSSRTSTRSFCWLPSALTTGPCGCESWRKLAKIACSLKGPRFSVKYLVNPLQFSFIDSLVDFPLKYLTIAILIHLMHWFCSRITVDWIWLCWVDSKLFVDYITAGVVSVWTKLDLELGTELIQLNWLILN